MKSKEVRDVSNHVVVTFLVIVILVSLVSLGAYLKAMDGTFAASAGSLVRTTAGQVAVSVVDGPVGPVTAAQTGQIGITVMGKGE